MGPSCKASWLTLSACIRELNETIMSLLMWLACTLSSVFLQESTGARSQLCWSAVGSPQSLEPRVVMGAARVVCAGTGRLRRSLTAVTLSWDRLT